MTKGELISACLKLMFDNNEQIDSTIISNNEEYSDRTNKITESINRAINRIWQTGKLPHSFYTIEYDSTVTTQFKKYNLTELISDFSRIVNVSLLNDTDGYINRNFNYQKLYANLIVLPKLDNHEQFIIEYVAKPLVVTLTMSDSTTLNLDEYALNMIPYFVKGDLYEEDNPTMALLARNTFESYLDDMPDSNYDNEYVNVYGEWF